MKIFMSISLLFAIINFSYAKDSSLNEKKLLKKAKRTFKSIRKIDVKLDKNHPQIALGKKLYFEKKLSINNTISCNSCHQLDNYGVDNQPTSPGHDGTRGERNSPTVYNASVHLAQFWDGRAKDVEEQALGPILNPIEHGLASKEDALKKIDTKEYRALFSKAFAKDKDSFSFSNIGKAIGAFERTLMTPSRFDDYLSGKKNALTKEELKGLDTFMKVGCTTCHSGEAIGGNMYQKLGLVKEYKTKDLGRFSHTKNDEDKYYFKVPGLRNIAKTAPYFHDGSVKTLEDAISIMAEYQLGKELSSEEIKSIKTFLETLTAKKL